MSHLSTFQVFLFLTILKIVVVLVITLTAVAYTVLLERKVLGRMQNRWGPSRVGPFGLLQPLADGIKLFLKEDLMPLAVERPLFVLAPLIALSLCAGLNCRGAVRCEGARQRTTVGRCSILFQISDINIGLLVILGITSIGVYGIALSGWSSNNKYSLFGSLRASAQLISYELALGLSLVGVVLRAGSLSLRDIVNSQSNHGMLSWNIFGGCQIIGFFIYLMAAYAETNRAPFDLPKRSPSLWPGYHTEYSSMKFAMFFMAEYANMITVACVATLMFFGGASSPFGHIFDAHWGRTARWFSGSLLPIFWFVAKILGFLLLYIWVRATVPRFRYDQLMGFGWKFLMPVAMMNILATALALAYHAASVLQSLYTTLRKSYAATMQLLTVHHLRVTGRPGSAESPVPAPSHQLGAVAHCGDDVAGGALLVAGRGVSRRGAGDRVLRRDHGAVCLRDHAAERGRRESQQGFAHSVHRRHSRLCCHVLHACVCRFCPSASSWA